MMVGRFSAAMAVVLSVMLVNVKQGHAAIVYQVNETITPSSVGAFTTDGQTLSAVGTITTDGAIGVLAASNILNFDIALNGFGSPTVLAKSTSTMLVTGNGLD